MIDLQELGRVKIPHVHLVTLWVFEYAVLSLNLHDVGYDGKNCVRAFEGKENEYCWDGVW